MPREESSRGSPEITLDDFVTDEVTGLETYRIADKVKERLLSLGIDESRFDRPILEEEHRGIFPNLKPGDYFDGRMPRVLKRLSLDQLSALSGLMNGWHQYIVSKRTLAAVERAEARQQAKFISSLVRSQYKESGGSDKEAEEAACQDFRYVEANSHLATIENVYNTLDDFAELAKSNMSTLSRELSNIRTKMEQELMGSGVGRPALRMQDRRREYEDEAAETTSRPPRREEPEPEREETPDPVPKGPGKIGRRPIKIRKPGK